MATTPQMKERIEAFVRELAAEWGEVDDSEALSWLDAIEDLLGKTEFALRDAVLRFV